MTHIFSNILGPLDESVLTNVFELLEYSTISTFRETNVMAKYAANLR